MKTVPKQPCLTRSHHHEDPRLIELVGSCPSPGPAHMPGGNATCLLPQALLHLSRSIHYSSRSSFPGSLFHFYNISSLGQVMKQHIVYYRQQNGMILSKCLLFIQPTTIEHLLCAWHLLDTEDTLSNKTQSPTSSL